MISPGQRSLRYTSDERLSLRLEKGLLLVATVHRIHCASYTYLYVRYRYWEWEWEWYCTVVLFVLDSRYESIKMVPGQAGGKDPRSLRLFF